MDPKLPTRDCHGCKERTLCHMRANTFLDTADKEALARVALASDLYSLSRVIHLSLTDLTAREAHDIVEFDRVKSLFETELGAYLRSQQEQQG